MATKSGHGGGTRTETRGGGDNGLNGVCRGTEGVRQRDGERRGGEGEGGVDRRHGIWTGKAQHKARSRFECRGHVDD